MKSVRLCALWLWSYQLGAATRVRRRTLSSGEQEATAGDPSSRSSSALSRFSSSSSSASSISSSSQQWQQQHHRALVPIQVVVGSFGTPFGPLQKCQGDCDFDFECTGTLKCFQRVANEPIPGCEEEDGTSQGMDFCYDPNDADASRLDFGAQAALEEPASGAATAATTTSSSTSSSPALVVKVGVLQSPPAGMLLGKCEGDCDWDSECAAGLECFYRSDNSPVPGCSGDTSSKYSHDFCIDPKDKVGVATPAVSTITVITAAPQQAPVPAPIPKVVTSNPVVPPSPVAAPVSLSSDAINLKVIVGVDATLPSGKLGKCQGDCDSDAECADGLLCLQRTDNGPVPGCTGETIGFRTGIDFCYDPADDKDGGARPPSTPTTQNIPSVPAPLATPAQPTIPRPVVPPVIASPFTTPPPSAIASNEGMTPGTNFLEIVGDGDSVGDLGRCKGDCDNDDDCFGEFVCYQKYSPDSYVPGCFGLGDGDQDYCIDPRDNPTNIHRDRFRLKLFWRTGYKWQEQEFELKFCIECADRLCEAGGGLVVSKCDDDGSNEEFHFIFRTEFELSVQVAGTNLCLDAPSTTTVVSLQDCDSLKPEQRFRPGIGDWDWDRFELETVVAPGCVVQRHHPKEGEPLYREDCEVARNDRTSLWNKYL